MPLRDQVAVITGAGRGIGHGITERFAKAGALVVIGEKDAASGQAAAERLRGQGFRAEAHPLDVTQAESCQTLTEAVMAAHGRLDVLVNNAGLFILHKSEDMPEADWRLQIDVLLTGVFLMTQAAARAAMIPQRRGSVVNIASIGGMGGWPMRSAYNAAKAGVDMLVKTTADEMGAAGVRVNGVNPGIVRTDLVAMITEESETGRSYLDSGRALACPPPLLLAAFSPLDHRSTQVPDIGSRGSGARRLLLRRR